MEKRDKKNRRRKRDKSKKEKDILFSMLGNFCVCWSPQLKNGLDWTDVLLKKVKAKVLSKSADSECPLCMPMSPLNPCLVGLFSEKVSKTGETSQFLCTRKAKFLHACQ